jgi:hypothetical protein
LKKIIKNQIKIKRINATKTTFNFGLSLCFMRVRERKEGGEK